MTTPKISRIDGSEGPRHDPYGFVEFTLVYREGRIATLHVGLGVWLQILQEGRPIIEVVGEELLRDDIMRGNLGMTLHEITEEWERQEGPPNACPSCGTDAHEFVESSGYVGEILLSCPKCHRIVWAQQVTKSMIE